MVCSGHRGHLKMTERVLKGDSKRNKDLRIGLLGISGSYRRDSKNLFLSLRRKQKKIGILKKQKQNTPLPPSPKILNKNQKFLNKPWYLGGFRSWVNVFLFYISELFLNWKVNKVFKNNINELPTNELPSRVFYF